MIMKIISIMCFGVCVAMANKTIHEKFNTLGNDLIKKLKRYE